jgi:hydroxyacylglutathione hydrolase
MEAPSLDLSTGLKVAGFTLGPLATNCYLAYCEESHEALLVDPGDVPDPVLALMEELELKLSLIVATHGHFDHICGVDAARAATGVPFLLHEADHGIAREPAKEVSFIFGAPLPSVVPDGVLVEGQVLTVGSHELTVVCTPGHTPGGVSLAAEGCVLTGDTLFCGSVGRTDLPGGDWDELMESIRSRLLCLPDQTPLLPGHGPRTTVGDERRDNPFL